jgi:serine/threonine protein kinase/Tol biopolymer transport system component
MPLSAGSRIGVYEIVAAIGRGGMGEVYRARDTRLHRDVAVKILSGVIADNDERLSRFRREAQLLASLNHPNIGQIFGLEEDGATQALILELVEGPTLADMMSTPLSVTDAIALARQIADALEFSHERGVIHRDLKPANVKVRPDGMVKVLDFGLAKALECGPGGTSPPPAAPDASAAQTMTSPAMTQMGFILGTAAYMAPEQAKGRVVDRRADIWAFGLVLYEMLTGRCAYAGEDVAETLAAVLTRDVDWTALPAHTPPRLRTLLADCLVRDPRQRLRDIGDARRVLDQLISGTPETSAVSDASPVALVPTHERWHRALPWAVAAIAVLGAAGGIWQTGRAPAPPAGVVTRSRMAIKDTAGFVNVSRDGTKLVYTVVGGPQGFFLSLRQMDQFTGQPIPGADGAYYPILSPDAQWIAYTSSTGRAQIRKIPITGGTSIALTDGSLAQGGDWGDDDTIVFSGPTGLLRVSASGGAPETLTTADIAKGEIAHRRPQFLPGGKQILFTITQKAPEGSSQFAVLDLQTGGYRTVGRGGDNGRYAPGGPGGEGGHLTFVRDNTLFAVPFDLRHLTVTGSETPMIQGVSTTGPPGTGDYTFSRNGVLVYAEGSSADGSVLSWADRTGALQAIPGQVPRRWGSGHLSPDGRRVADGMQADKGSDIWIVDLQRDAPNRLTFGGDNNWPIWTPDGRQIFYSAALDGKFGISSVRADGSSQPHQVLSTERVAIPVSMTPDGQTLLYREADAAGRSRIFVVALGTSGTVGEPRLLREGNGEDTDAAVSPDGKWVAFSSWETGASEIFLMAFPGSGGRTRVSAAGGRSPRWSRDGRELFFLTGRGVRSALTAVRVQTAPSLAVSAQTALFQLRTGTTWDPAPDDRFLVELAGNRDAGTSFATVTNWFDEVRRRAPAK